MCLDSSHNINFVFLESLLILDVRNIIIEIIKTIEKHFERENLLKICFNCVGLSHMNIKISYTNPILIFFTSFYKKFKKKIKKKENNTRSQNTGVPKFIYLNALGNNQSISVYFVFSFRFSFPSNSHLFC